MNGDLTLEVSSRSRIFPMCLVAVGAVAAIYGLLANPERTWPNLLLDGFYITSLGVSAIFFLASQRLTGARWSANLRRIPEAFTRILPIAAILLLAVFLGRQTLYPWMRPGIFAHTPAIAGKIQYLNAPWVLTRMVIALAVWIVFAWLFRKTSIEQDQNPRQSLALHHRLSRYSVLFVAAFAITFTMAAYDWLISLEPEWSSTMFAVYIFAGTFVQGIAAVTLAVVLLKERGTLGNVVSQHQIHDLGKMLFAFSTFWAYIWTCQYLLIWYGNIPDEVTHYAKRTNGPWLYLFALNFILNWIIPFLVLLSVRAKCTTKVLKTICIVVLIGHWLDLYMMIMPAVWKGPKIGLLEIPIAAGYIALLYLVFVSGLRKAPLVPLNDPILAYERLHGIHTAELHTS
jgi:hypothetical protein